MADYGGIAADASDQCSLLGAGPCKLVNADSYTLVLAAWISLQLVWVTLLVLTQLFQVSRAMTTYENMTGVHLGPATTRAVTSTGAPLDPDVGPMAPGAEGGGGTSKAGGGALKRWSRLLGVDPLMETLAGRAAVTGKHRRRRKNPYSRGCVSDCKDFWCDPAPVFGRRETGSGLLAGAKVDYKAIYESPPLMRLTGMQSRGQYEALGTEDV